MGSRNTHEAPCLREFAMFDVLSQSARREPAPSAAAVLRTWRRRVREREELARMSERELRDFGATPSERLREISKPFCR